MKSIWLVAIIVVSVALTKAEKNAFRYKLVMNVLETMQKHGRSLDPDLRSKASIMDQEMDGQRTNDEAVQNIEKNLAWVATKVDYLEEILADHTQTVESQLDWLIELASGESGCSENATDGVYQLKVYRSKFPVYCENGWIVIHRRINGSLDFNRTWAPYKEGFGDLQGEHWLGLDKMYQITRAGSYELKVVLKSFEDVEKTAKFEGFKIDSELEQYQLNLKKFVEGDAGNSLMYHNQMRFSTLDRDNDGKQHEPSCAEIHSSGWWYTNCLYANLNGPYNESITDNQESMNWYRFNDNHECLKEARMMIRAVKSNK